MDNASKALIIAGSALIAVLIVSLGIAVFNSASNVAEQGRESVNSASVSAFNGQFEKYFGRSRTHDQALALSKLVKVNNSNADNPRVYCTADPDWFYANSRAAYTYDIKGHYGTGGYIDIIEIVSAGSPSNYSW